MNRTYSFICTLFINNTTPERVWSAITSNEFVKHFLGPIETDWEPGSVLKTFGQIGKGGKTGLVLASMAPRALSYTWSNSKDKKRISKKERLTWLIGEIDPGMVRLKLIHENLTEQERREVQSGWILCLEGLRIGLEAENAIGRRLDR